MNDSARKTILLVDDEVLIAEAEAMMLEDHGYTVLRVHNGKKAVETALGEAAVDLVLMDVDLGRGMDGPEAARQILKERNLPIVFLTSHSEREMVDSVKSITRYGYVIKNSGDFVLLSSIDMAFELFEAHQKTREREEKFRLMAENSTDVIWTMDLEGRFTYASPSVTAQTGYTPEEVLRLSLQDYLVETYVEPVMKEIERELAMPAEKRSKSRTLEVQHYRKDGSIVDVEVTVGWLVNDRGEIIGIQGSTRDITERKRVEKDLENEREQMLSVFDSLDEVIYVTDMDTYEVLFANKKIQQTFNKNLVGGVCYREIQRLDAPCPFCTNDIIRKMNHQPYRWEYYNPVVDRHYQLIDRVIRWPDGRDVRFEMAVDITERKKAEEKLRESLNNLNRSEKISGAGSWSWDIASDRFIASPEGLRLWGFGPDERPAFADIGSLIHPDDRPAAREALVNSLHSGEPYSIEIRIRKKDTGEERHLLSVAEIEMGADGRAARVFGVNRDITERVKNETALRDSKEKYCALVEEINDVVYALDGEGVITFISPAIAKITALTPGEITHRTFSDFIHPDDLTMVIERYKRYIDGDISPADFRISDGGGGYLWVRSSGNPVYTDGQFAGVRGTLQNITEVKQAENELREREEKFRALAEYSHNGIAIIDDAGRFVYVNGEFCRITGYSEDELIGTPFLNSVSPENKDIVAKRYASHKRDNDIQPRHEFHLRRKDGEIRLIESNFAVFKDSAGRINSIEQIIDITERRMAEDLLRLERDLGTALASATRLEDALTLVMEAGLSINGIDCGGIYMPDRETGALTLTVHHGLSADFIRSVYNYPPDSPQYSMLATGIPIYGSYEQIRPSSDHVREREGLRTLAVVPIVHKGILIAGINMASKSLVSIPLFIQRALETLASLAGGALVRLRGEEELIESELRFKALSESNRLAIFMIQRDRFTYFNRAFIEMTGFDETDIQRLWFWELFHPDDQETVRLRGQAHQRGEDVPHRYESRLLTKSGRSIWIELSLSLITLRGVPTTIGIAIDITERHLHEEEMERSLLEKNTLLSEIHHRVKNNLQIISSLMNLQAETLADSQSRNIFDNCRSRIHSMALIHESLYKSSEFSRIDLKDYLERMIRMMGHAYSRADVTVMLEADPVQLDLEQAIPCGLILNELITNSLAHAFPNRGGTITVLARRDAEKIRIVVQDNGIGFPEKGKREGGLGTQLVNLLAHQLRGNIGIQSNGGTTWTLVF